MLNERKSKSLFLLGEVRLFCEVIFVIWPKRQQLYQFHLAETKLFCLTNHDSFFRIINDYMTMTIYGLNLLSK